MHPRRLVAKLDRDELLDWLALWEIDPWGPKRDDLRSAVQGFRIRYGEDEAIKVEYPYVANDSEDDLISMLEADAENGPAT